MWKFGGSQIKCESVASHCCENGEQNKVVKIGVFFLTYVNSLFALLSPGRSLAGVLHSFGSRVLEEKYRPN